jgi:hypothetical protein
MNTNTLIDTNPGLYMAHAYAAQFFDQCSCLLDARTPLKMTNAQFNECIENLKTACEASGVEVKDVLETVARVIAQREPGKAERLRAVFSPARAH